MNNFEIDTNSDSEILSSFNTAVYFEDINLVRPGKEINSLIYVKRISSDDFIYSVDLKIKVLFDSDGDVCYDKVHEYVIKTEDFVLVGGHLDVYNALSEMTDDSVNVFDFKEYKFD